MVLAWLTIACISCFGCGDQLVTPEDQQQARYAAVHVSDLDEFKAALRAGRTWIVIDAPLHFDSPDDAVDLDQLVPMSSGNLITIQGGGDWGSGQLNRLASFNAPLIRAGKSREWEFRLRGLLFDGWNESGPALRLEYVQLSLFDDIRVQRFGGPEPFSVGHAGATSASEFRDIQLNHNEYPAVIHNASDVRWRGGASHATWGGWSSGLTIYGGPHTPATAVGGPVLVEDIHMEGSVIRIEDAYAVTFRGGFIYVSQVRIDRSTPVHVDCNGYYYAGGLWVNGVLRCANTDGAKAR